MPGADSTSFTPYNPGAISPYIGPSYDDEYGDRVVPTYQNQVIHLPEDTIVSGDQFQHIYLPGGSVSGPGNNTIHLPEGTTLTGDWTSEGVPLEYTMPSPMAPYFENIPGQVELDINQQWGPPGPGIMPQMSPVQYGPVGPVMGPPAFDVMPFPGIQSQPDIHPFSWGPFLGGFK